MSIRFLDEFSSLKSMLGNTHPTPTNLFKPTSSIHKEKRLQNIRSKGSFNNIDNRNEFRNSIRARLVSPLAVAFDKLKPVENLPLDNNNKLSNDVIKSPQIVNVVRGRELNIPAEKKEIAKNIVEQSIKNNVEPELALSLAYQESGFQTNVVSKDGHSTKGIYQLKDSTGKELLSKYHSGKKYNPFDSELNIDLGIKYLKELNEIFTNGAQIRNGLKVFSSDANSVEKFSLAAFNAGQGRVAYAQNLAQQNGQDPSKYSSVENFLPLSTRQYVSSIVSKKPEFQKLF
jgi:soluble lytic murein transglycosylase-like protein